MGPHLLCCYNYCLPQDCSWESSSLRRARLAGAKRISGRGLTPWAALPWPPCHVQVPSGCQSGVVDAKLQCCTSGLVGSQGDCCPSGAVLDAAGACCTSGMLDACGVCSGAGKVVDISGACCPTLVDANGVCCQVGCSAAALGPGSNGCLFPSSCNRGGWC